MRDFEILTRICRPQIRIDKATQMTVAALADWASTTRNCATKLGKTNFYIPGEITGGNTFGSLYLCAPFHIRVSSPR